MYNLEDGRDAAAVVIEAGAGRHAIQMCTQHDYIIRITLLCFNNQVPAGLGLFPSHVHIPVPGPEGIVEWLYPDVDCICKESIIFNDFKKPVRCSLVAGVASCSVAVALSDIVEPGKQTLKTITY